MIVSGVPGSKSRVPKVQMGDDCCLDKVDSEPSHDRMQPLIPVIRWARESSGAIDFLVADGGRDRQLEDIAHRASDTAGLQDLDVGQF